MITQIGEICTSDHDNFPFKFITHKSDAHVYTNLNGKSVRQLPFIKHKSGASVFQIIHVGHSQLKSQGLKGNSEGSLIKSISKAR